MLECLEALEKCLRSIPLGGESAPLEVVVVDNGSTDGDPDLAEREFPLVHLIRRGAKGGYTTAVNEGIHASKRNFIAIINSDIVLTPNCLDALRQFIEGNPKVGLAGPRLLQPDGSLNSTCHRFPTLWSNLWSVTGLHRLFPRGEYFGAA